MLREAMEDVERSSVSAFTLSARYGEVQVRFKRDELEIGFALVSHDDAAGEMRDCGRDRVSETWQHRRSCYGGRPD